MSKLTRRLVNVLSSALETQLRESVIGDLTELRISDTRTIYELIGLILRQEVQHWRIWRPWLALIGIVGAIGWLLSKTCLEVIDDFSRQAFIYWQYGVALHNGLTGVQEVELLISVSLAVVCWSWLGGFTLAALSGKTVFINGTLFYLVWFCLCGPLGILVYLVRLVLAAMSLIPSLHGVNFSAFVFFATVHLLLATLLFLVPSLMGMKRGKRSAVIAKPYAILFSLAVATLTALVTWIQGWRQVALEKWSEGKWSPGGASWQERLVPLLVLSWPILYLLTVSAHSKKRPITS